MGNPFGAAGDVAAQRSILSAALEVATHDVPYGTIVDWDRDWPTDFLDKVAANLLAM